MSLPSRCSSCAASVPSEALETGAAILLLGKVYCASCKSAASQAVTLEELAAPPPPPLPPKAPTAKPAAPKAKPAPPPEPPPPARERAPRPGTRRVPRAAAPSRKPLALGLGALALLAAVALALAFRPGPAPSPARPDPRPEDSSSTTSPADPEARAKQAYAAVEVLLRRGDVEPDRVLAAIEAARPACRGTPYAAKLDEARTQVLADKERAEAGKALEPLLEELKKAVAEDKDFRRYAELQEKFQKARELAALASPSAVSSLALLQQDYGGRYEKEAQPHYDRIAVAAEQLANEKRYDDALKFIESFPEHLRGSGAWRGLAKLKERVERDKKLSPK